MDPSTLPLLQLPTAARTRWRVQGAIVGVIVLLVPGVPLTVALSLGISGAFGLLTPLALIATGAALGVLWANKRYERFGYLLGHETLRVRDGVVQHTDAVAPLYRVQHVDLQRGPLQLSFGLATLTIHTAAPAADIKLPDLEVREAERLRDQILGASRRAAQEMGTADVDAV